MAQPAGGAHFDVLFCVYPTSAAYTNCFCAQMDRLPRQHYAFLVELFSFLRRQVRATR